ncbi:MAG TPA: nuclear transport factor 2 family protein [Fimbriimonadaceae bacterium]|nr:nuclear transport factor 2 family protein [Fimbriimonadaceae bacterium]
MDQIWAEAYAGSWIEAWNSRDLEALGDHYAEDVVFHSPFIPKLVDNPSCTIHGREALLAYLQKGMDVFPHMRFQLHRVGVGVDSLALNYISVDGALANEVHVINSEGKASEVRIHYSAAL